ncbi:MAG TPA: HupE/UreJ family protein [Casimicrobiaceae bacterium]|nr:HupE/UreJ family protein [Casimicrobiaceae bacterium]
MTRIPDCRFSRSARLWLIVASVVLLISPTHVAANGADLPSEIVLQGFLKPEGSRVRLLLRVPLVLLSNFALPQRGPGYLDLAHAADRLNEVAQATGRQIEISDEGAPLIPMVRAARISVLSDRSFGSYDTARASLEGPRLPVETELFWNQGFFDAALEYPLHSADAHLSIRANVAPELLRRVKLHLTFLPVGAPPRTYEIASGTGWIPLDPTTSEAAWLSLKGGFVDSFAFDRLAFLLCLIAPFRNLRSLLAVVVVMAGMQALTLTATGARWFLETPWLQPLADTTLAAAILLLAIGNLSAPSLRRRWFVAALMAALGGFAIGPLFVDRWQFAGAHAIVAAVSYNAGIVIGAIVILVASLIVLRALFAWVLGAPLGVIVLSALLGLVAWQWLFDGVHRFQHVADAGISAASIIAVVRWLVPAVLLGAAAYFLPRNFGGERVQTLRDALFPRRVE